MILLDTIASLSALVPDPSEALSLDNPIAHLEKIVVAIQKTTKAAGNALGGPALSILSAATGIRIVRAWLESAFDGDALSLINEAIYSLVVATILAMAITHYDEADMWAWRLSEDAVKLVTNGKDSGSVLQGLWSSTVAAFNGVLSLLTEPDAKPTCADLGATEKLLCEIRAPLAAFQANVIVAGFVVVALILLVIYAGIMLFQALRGIFQIAVGLMWLPLTLGFYPLIDSWFKNALGQIASGIANLAMVAVLLKLVSNITDQMLLEAKTMNVIALPPESFASAPINKIVAVMIVCMAMVVFGFLASAAMSYGTSIFGATSGWGSIKPGKSSPGNKGGDKGGDKGGATDAAGKLAGGGEAAGTAAKVAQAGAAVAAAPASGGASAAAGAVGTAASTAGTMSKLASAFQGARSGASAGAQAAGGGAASRALGAGAGAASGAVAGSRMAGRGVGAAARAGRMVGKGAGASAAAGGLKGAAGSASRLAGRGAMVGAAKAGAGVASAGRAAAKVGGYAAAAAKSRPAGFAMNQAKSFVKFYARNTNND